MSFDGPKNKDFIREQIDSRKKIRSNFWTSATALPYCRRQLNFCVFWS